MSHGTETTTVGEAPVAGLRIRRMDYEPAVSPRADLSAESGNFGPVTAVDLRTEFAPVGVTAELAADPTAAPQVQRVLTLMLQVLDRRRPLAQLAPLVTPPVVRYLHAVLGAGVRPRRSSRLVSLRVAQPAYGAAEVTAMVVIDGRPRALAARFDRRDHTWCATVVCLL